MCRLFQTHHIRKSLEIPQLWDLQIPGKGKEKISVPCCVESIPEYSSYKGECAIATRLRCSGNLRLTFHGVGHTANVFLDDQHLGSHYGAYGQFSFLLKDLPDAVHDLTVKADNSYSNASALHRENDYYSYLGITRPVVLEQLQNAYIQWLHITPQLVNGSWQLKVQASVENISANDLDLLLRLSLSDSDDSAAGLLPSALLSIHLSPGQTEVFETLLNCPGVEAYLPETPKLYYIHGQLSEQNQGAFDDLIERFGFREVRVDGTRILFNGKPLRIKGFNRHEEYAEFGSSVPLSAMVRDIQLIRAAGANCIRTSHYPNDQRFLDLCDENGLLVWEEAHARTLSEAVMRNPHFLDQSRLSITEMITWHYNHPSIFVWGLLNECASDTEYGRSCYSQLIGLIRSLDSSRPVTYASNRHFEDICQDLADILSYNIYPMWYTDQSFSQLMDKTWAHASSNGCGNKPILISEIGAGAIYGFRSGTCCKWSEEFQAEELREEIPAVLSDSRCSGVIIWQFADCRVDEDLFAKRPKCQNNKGVLDIYRREKLGYAVVRDLFHKLP